MYMALPVAPHFSRAEHVKVIEVEEEELDTSDLHAHVVSPQSKYNLLSGSDRHFWPPTPPTSASSFNISGEGLIQDLNELAPSVAKTVVPQQTAKDAFVFRLINDTGYMGEEESYIAMSYTWKKVQHDTPRKEMSGVGDLPFGWVRTVERFPLPTSRSMFEAVLRERVIGGEGLWFDQVCINQDDALEKSVAAGCIDTIYSSARTVVVALDDISISSSELNFLRYYIEIYSTSNLPINHHPNRGLEPPFMQQYPLFRSFVEKVLDSIWFERAWCAHELRSGRSHVFIVPCQAEEDEIHPQPYTFVRFTGEFFLHMLFLAAEVIQTTALSTQFSRIRSLVEFFSRTVWKEQYSTIAAYSPGAKVPQLPTQEPCFVPLIAEIFAQKAGGNPRMPEYLRRLDANRDKTCIALNSSGLPLALRPISPLQRPNIEDECLRQLLLIALAARDPVSLCTTGPPLRLHDGSISWLCKPSLLDVPYRNNKIPRFIPGETPIRQASDGRAEYVQLDLIFLDLPHRSQPNPNFTSNIQRSRLFVDVAIQAGFSTATGIWNTCLSPQHPRSVSLRNVFVQTLACVFECNAQWLLDVSANLQQEQQQLDAQTINILFDPNLIVQNYIAMTEGQRAFSLLLGFLSHLITMGIPWASGATERTHGPLIISSPPPSTSPVSSSPYAPLETGCKAIIFAPFEHSKTLLVAVPNTLKSADYAPLSRGWILTSLNPYTGSPHQMVSWTLQSKGTIFGERGFGESLARGAGGSRNHRVFGPNVQ